MKTADSRRELGQHSDGAVIEWIAFQPVFQQRLSLMKLVGEQRVAGMKQHWIGSRGLDSALFEFSGFFGLAICSHRQPD